MYKNTLSTTVCCSYYIAMNQTCHILQRTQELQNTEIHNFQRGNHTHTHMKATEEAKHPLQKCRNLSGKKIYLSPLCLGWVTELKLKFMIHV